MNKKIFAFVNLIILAVVILVPTLTLADHRDSRTERDIDDLDEDIVEKLPVPVLFGIEVRNLTRNFGDPRAGHLHEGLDLMSPEGTPVVSPTDAVVVRTGDGPGSGLYVSTAAPGGETFVYMHLSKIADIDEGDVLKPGDVIGYVGYTGNAVAAAPHLHFEIRDEDRDPKDPYPRLTHTFTLADKIKYLEAILDDVEDVDEFSEFLVTKFRGEFTAAQAQGIKLPEEVAAAMLRIPAPAGRTSGTSGSSTGTLKLGSRGPEVVALQAYLIKKGIGSASRVVADGSFGPITRQALIDFQASAGLTADGVYGPRSKAYVIAHP